MRRRLITLTIALSLTFISVQQPRTTPAWPGGTQPIVVRAGDPDDLGQRPTDSESWLGYLTGWLVTWVLSGEVL